MSELIGAGESGWWVPGESGSAFDLYLALKKLSENPIGSSYLKVFRHLVREKSALGALGPETDDFERNSMDTPMVPSKRPDLENLFLKLWGPKSMILKRV